MVIHATDHLIVDKDGVKYDIGNRITIIIIILISSVFLLYVNKKIISVYRSYHLYIKQKILVTDSYYHEYKDVTLLVVIYSISLVLSITGSLQ